MTLSRRNLFRGTLALAGASVAGVAIDRLAPRIAQAAAPTLKFQSSGISGGGFQNVIAVSPHLDSQGNKTYLLGADVAGIHRSVDGGRSWRPPGVNRPGTHVAVLKWVSGSPGKCFALTNEGLFRSQDFGVSWFKRTGSVDADANGVYQTSEGEHPRATGNLIATGSVTGQAGAIDYMWVGTATQGVKRSTDDGNTWDAIALGREHIRSVVVDPIDPDVVYVAVRNSASGTGPGTVGNNGIWWSTNATSTMTFGRMSAYPGASKTPEEMWIFSDSGVSRLYVAGGRDGVFEFSDGSWKNRSSGLDTGTGSTGAVWLSIFAYRDSSTGGVVVYAGATKCVQRRAIMKSTNGGATWKPVSVSSTGLDVTDHYTLYGSTDNWFLQGDGYHEFAGNQAWTAAHINGDASNREVILVAGRGGAWFGVQSPGAVDWYPANAGLMVTVNNSVDTDPQVPAILAVGNMDYQCVASSNHGRTAIVRGTGAGGDITTGDMVFFDRDGAAGAESTCYIGASRRGTLTNQGEVFSNPNVSGGGSWANQQLPVNGDAVAVAATKAPNGARILLVSVQGDRDSEGNWLRPNRLYRKVLGSGWQSPITGGPFAGNHAGWGNFAVRRGSSTIYAFDPVGIWRSNEAGAQGSWVKIAAGSAGYNELDSLAIDPANPSIVYFVDGGVVKRITNAATSSGLPGTTGESQIQTIYSGSAGPISVSASGALYGHVRGDSAKLMYAANPRSALPVSFTNVADQFYAENAGSIRSLHVATDGYVYTADNGNGAMIGVPQA